MNLKNPAGYDRVAGHDSTPTSSPVHTDEHSLRQLEAAHSALHSKRVVAAIKHKSPAVHENVPDLDDTSLWTLDLTVEPSSFALQRPDPCSKSKTDIATVSLKEPARYDHISKRDTSPTSTPLLAAELTPRQLEEANPTSNRSSNTNGTNSGGLNTPHTDTEACCCDEACLNEADSHDGVFCSSGCLLLFMLWIIFMFNFDCHSPGLNGAGTISLVLLNVNAIRGALAGKLRPNFLVEILAVGSAFLVGCAWLSMIDGRCSGALSGLGGSNGTHVGGS